MTEKPSPLAFEACTFMANYGLRCGNNECRARDLRRSKYYNSNSKLPADEKARLRSEIKSKAALAGCPIYTAKPES